MSIASEITRLQNAKTSLKTSINAKTDAQHQINNETLEDYSTFVDSITTGGGTPTLQNKTITITDNTTTIITADSGYDGLGTVEIITNVQPQSEIDENTLLLLHFDNSYADSSQYSQVPSATGNTINYGAGKFDTSLNATSNQQGIITYSQLNDLITHDFTIDFWVYPTSFSATNSMHGRPIMGDYLRNQWWVYWSIHIGEYQVNPKKWGIKYEQDDGTNGFTLYSNTELVTNTWQHLAITYNKATKKVCLFTNGIKDGETTIPVEMIRPTSGGGAPDVFTIGNWMSNYQYPPLSYIDELRISDVVRYTENFTPHTKPYE